MSISKYIKSTLSHLSYQTLEKTSSDLNPVLEVGINNGRVQLATENAIYSYEDYYVSYNEAFKKLGEKKLKSVDSLLVLGFALGSISTILKKTYKHIPTTTGVEIDSKIIELNEKHGFNDEKLNIINADAIKFIQNHPNYYDMICVDLFNDDVVPKEASTIEFLENCKQSLNNGGLLLFNRLINNTITKSKTMAFYEQVFKKVFPTHEVCKTKGNLVFIGKA